MWTFLRTKKVLKISNREIFLINSRALDILISLLWMYVLQGTMVNSVINCWTHTRPCHFLAFVYQWDVLETIPCMGLRWLLCDKLFISFLMKLLGNIEIHVMQENREEKHCDRLKWFVCSTMHIVSTRVAPKHRFSKLHTLVTGSRSKYTWIRQSEQKKNWKK